MDRQYDYIVAKRFQYFTNWTCTDSGGKNGLVGFIAPLGCINCNGVLYYGKSLAPTRKKYYRV